MHSSDIVMTYMYVSVVVTLSFVDCKTEWNACSSIAFYRKVTWKNIVIFSKIIEQTLVWPWNCYDSHSWLFFFRITL